MGLLDGRLALVTGAGRGLGAAIACGYAQEGARVIVADIDLATAKATAKSIAEAGGRAWGEALDVTDRDGVHAFAGHVQATYGSIGILVNNAGVSGQARIDSDDALALWDRVIAVNLNGVYSVTHAFVPALKATRGTIINMASVTAFSSGGTNAAYTASKGAVRSLTQQLTSELSQFGIRVNAIAPGLMATELTAHRRADPQKDPYFLRTPMGRYGQPEDLIGPAVFLASDMARFVTGVTLPVDGGYLAI